MTVRTLLAIASLAFMVLQACDPRRDIHRWDFEAMGTAARVEIFHTESESAADGFRIVRAVFDSVEAVMSTWDPNSEISHVNRAPAGSVLALSPWLDDCLSRAEEVRGASGGAFDPTAEPLMRLWGFYRGEGRLPAQAQIDSARALVGRYRHIGETRSLVKELEGTSFDLGGIAKGYAIDRAAEALRALGIENALIDLGGNLFCMGAPPGRETWRVGVRDPQDKDRLFAVLQTTDRAVATSGSYERYVIIDGRRYGHIMNPSTGRPAEGLLSVTVLAANATLADGLSTALFVAGFEEARNLISRSYPDVGVVFVLSPQGGGSPKAMATSNLEGRIALSTKRGRGYALEFF